MSEQSKCPITGAGTPPKFPTGRGTSNRDWWPNSLNLKILSQHSSLVDPMDCLLYTSDAADEGLGVDLGGRRIIKKRFT